MEEKQTVDLIASGYEWECPRCHHLNLEIEVPQSVKCSECGAQFDVGDYEHAIGSYREF